MFWGGAVFTSGWIMRAVSSYNVANQNLYIAATVLVLAGPPIYSAAEYNILGRLMHYLPMHAPLNPSRLLYFFIYLGVAVESLTAAGGSRAAVAGDDKAMLKSGLTLISIAATLQGVVECVFIGMVALLHYRCVKTNMLTPKVRTIFIMLYGTSTLILLRSIFRAVENFSLVNVVSSENCDATCNGVIKHEWYIYVFEAAPMVAYTYWLNIIHPGRLLPVNPKVYLDFNGVERTGPGWIDTRSTWVTFVDLFDIRGRTGGKPKHDQYWLRPDEWPEAV